MDAFTIKINQATIVIIANFIIEIDSYCYSQLANFSFQLDLNFNYITIRNLNRTKLIS